MASATNLTRACRSLQWLTRACGSGRSVTHAFATTSPACAQLSATSETGQPACSTHQSPCFDRPGWLTTRART